MKAVILAGGFGTRISEESTVRPKPMVNIGPEPIIWHIMKMYQQHGINEFIVACGYKGHMIKEYFSGLFLAGADITFDIKNNTMEVHEHEVEPWKVTCVDTGLDSMTGGRLLGVKKYLNADEPFCMTYGDGVSDVNITDSIRYHKEQGCLATMTAIKPPGRFGAFTLAPGDPKVNDFVEKPQGDKAWINGGFFVLEPQVFDFLPQDSTEIMWEQDPLKKLATSNELMAYKHHGFWKCMDHLRDKTALDELWEANNAAWKSWE